MPMPDHKIISEEQSGEVDEIITSIPSWIIRRGTTFIFLTVVILFLAAGFIKYPEVLTGNVVLTTKHSPASLVARRSGHLRLFREDHQTVEKGTKLALIDNPARLKDIEMLAEKLKALKTPNSFLSDTFFLTFNPTLGEIQDDYMLFLNALKTYKTFTELMIPQKRAAALKERINHFSKLNAQLEKQNRIVAAELALARIKLKADSILWKERVIADLDFNVSKSNYLQRLRTYESTRSDIINNDIQISALSSSINDLHLDKSEKDIHLFESLQSAKEHLLSKVSLWEQDYLFRAPFSGKIAFSKFWSDDQFVKEGEEVMTIVPVTEDLYAQMTLSVSGSGKVAKGQRVNMRFKNYPSSEYGIVTGTVEAISLLPVENLYTIKIHLPHGLRTSYGKVLEFRQEMQGTADVVTKDMTLLERVFNQLRALTDRT
jgi:hypothetical protein